MPAAVVVNTIRFAMRSQVLLPLLSVAGPCFCLGSDGLAGSDSGLPTPRSYAIAKIGNGQLGTFVFDSGFINLNLDAARWAAALQGQAALPGECGLDQVIGWEIREGWVTGSTNFAVGPDACGRYKRMDPTMVCSQDSGNPYCTPCKLTGDPNKNYQCTPEGYINDTYSCEVGDLTGRLGPIVVGADRDVRPVQISDRHLPPAFVLDGDVLVLTCNQQPLVCMEIITETTDSPSPLTVAEVTGTDATRATPTKPSRRQSNELRPYALRARFNDPQIKGDVHVQWTGFNAQLRIASTANVPRKCEALTMHIHDEIQNSWNQEGAMCTPAYLGGVYDPTNACGSMSDSQLCRFRHFGCIPASSFGEPYSPNQDDVGTYVCDPKMYRDLPYACMVGDLSGKYGQIPYQNATDGSVSVLAQITDPRMPSLKNLAGRGLTVRCGNDVWCATLQPMCGDYCTSCDDVEEVCTGCMESFVLMDGACQCPEGEEVLNGKCGVVREYAIADFLGIELAYVLIDGNYLESGVDFRNDKWQMLGGRPPPECLGMQVRFSINDEWNYAAGNAIGPGACTPEHIGGRFDPTLACSAESGNPACKICVHPTVNKDDYKCTNETYHSDPYSCEAGDLGGIYGSFEVGDDQWLNINFTDRRLPPAKLLENRSVVLHCANDVMMCMKFRIERTVGPRLTFLEQQYSDDNRRREDMAVTRVSRAAAPTAVIPVAEESDVANVGPERSRRELTFNHEFEQLAASFDHPDLAGTVLFSRRTILADLVLKNGFLLSQCPKGGLEMLIYSRWMLDEIAASGELCSREAIGDMFDPGHACPPQSASPLCASRGGCVIPKGGTRDKPDYECSPLLYQKDPYYCAVGDVSNRLGLVGTAADANVTMLKVQFDDARMVPLALLWHKALVLRCGRNIWCSKINATYYAECGANCKYCDDETRKCVQCEQSYALAPNGESCQCPTGQSVIEGICQSPCGLNCKLCTVRTECSQCNDGFFIDQNNRANCGCMPGNFYDGKACQSCKKFGEYCASCTATNCTSCAGNQVFDPIKEQCVCPTGKYQNGAFCYQCAASCEVCQTATQCNKCRAPYELNADQCACPSTNFWDSGVGCEPLTVCVPGRGQEVVKPTATSDRVCRCNEGYWPETHGCELNLEERKQAETEVVFEGAPLSSYNAATMRRAIADTLNNIRQTTFRGDRRRQAAGVMGPQPCTTGSLPFAAEHVRDAENSQRGSESFATYLYVVDPCTKRPYKAQFLSQWINTNSSAIGRSTTGIQMARAVAIAAYPDGTVNGQGSGLDSSTIGLIVGSAILAIALIGLTVGLIYMRCRLRGSIGRSDGMTQAMLQPDAGTNVEMTSRRVTLDGESGTELNLGGYSAPSSLRLNKATL